MTNKKVLHFWSIFVSVNWRGWRYGIRIPDPSAGARLHPVSLQLSQFHGFGNLWNRALCVYRTPSMAA